MAPLQVWLIRFGNLHSLTLWDSPAYHNGDPYSSYAAPNREKPSALVRPPQSLHVSWCTSAAPYHTAVPEVLNIILDAQACNGSQIYKKHKATYSCSSPEELAHLYDDLLSWTC